MRNVNDGTTSPPRIAIYANEWGLSELPRRPSEETWSFEQCLDRVAAAGFDGCQAAVGRAAAVRSRGLRFCTSGRVDVPDEADAVVASAAAARADCLTLHVGWGMETDGQIDALIAAILAASARHELPVYVETHRATITQDLYRTRCLLERHPDLAINADLSHYYCGQELPYRGLAAATDALQSLFERTRFMHARIATGQCMQCDLEDPMNAAHVQAFEGMWRSAYTTWQSRARAGDLLPFVPELGPPSAGYSICTHDAGGKMIELCDRWQQTLRLRTIGLRLLPN